MNYKLKAAAPSTGYLDEKIKTGRVTSQEVRIFNCSATLVKAIAARSNSTLEWSRKSVCEYVPAPWNNGITETDHINTFNNISAISRASLASPSMMGMMG